MIKSTSSRLANAVSIKFKQTEQPAHEIVCVSCFCKEPHRRDLSIRSSQPYFELKICVYNKKPTPTRLLPCFLFFCFVRKIFFSKEKKKKNNIKVKIAPHLARREAAGRGVSMCVIHTRINFRMPYTHQEAGLKLHLIVVFSIKTNSVCPRAAGGKILVNQKRPLRFNTHRSLVHIHISIYAY